MRLIVLIAVALGPVTAAFAQPGQQVPSDPPQDPGTQASAPVQPSATRYAVAQAPDRLALHRGLTFDANLGIGFALLSDGAPTESTDAAFAADFGLGGWLSPRLALTARVAGNQVRPMYHGDKIVQTFVGPSLQYWAGAHVWLGGGAGVATYGDVGYAGSCPRYAYSISCGVVGWGLDLRAGYSLGETDHAFNVSVELTPAFYSNNGMSVTVTNFALLAGYQFL